MTVLAELTDVRDTHLDVETDYETAWIRPEVELQEKVVGSGVQPTVRAETSIQQCARVSPPVIKPPVSIRRTEWTETMQQQWECIALEVLDDCVACEMHDLLDESKPTEFAEVYLTQFSAADRDLLQEGTVFYWSVGYETRRTGQIKGFSTIRVRRMPPLTASQKKSIASEAAEFRGLFSAPT